MKILWVLAILLFQRIVYGTEYPKFNLYGETNVFTVTGIDF